MEVQICHLYPHSPRDMPPRGVATTHNSGVLQQIPTQGHLVFSSETYDCGFTLFPVFFRVSFEPIQSRNHVPRRQEEVHSTIL